MCRHSSIFCDKLLNFKFLLKLIDGYRSLPALWQIKSKEYSDRQKKDSAYETILFLIKYRDYYKEDTKDELRRSKTHFFAGSSFAAH